MIRITVDHNSDEISVTNDNGTEVLNHKISGSVSGLEEFLEKLFDVVYGTEPEHTAEDVELYRMDEDNHKSVASWSVLPLKY